MRKITLLTILTLLPTLTTAITGAEVVRPFYRLICEVFKVPHIAISLAVMMWAYAGAKWIISQDDEEQRMLAKDIAVYVLVGLAILITAEPIVRIIFGVGIPCP